jgi:hypothetical protein
MARCSARHLSTNSVIARPAFGAVRYFAGSVDYRDFGKGGRGQSDLDWFPGQVIDILKQALSGDGKRQVECEVNGTF